MGNISCSPSIVINMLTLFCYTFILFEEGLIQVVGFTEGVLEITNLPC